VPDHELAGIAKRVGPENYGLYDAEDSRYRTDSERENHNGRDGKAGRFGEPADGVAKVRK